MKLLVIFTFIKNFSLDIGNTTYTALEAIIPENPDP
jgi:hypothetical protein